MPDSHLGNQWRQLPGRAVDIGVGGDGSVWITGPRPNGSAGDFGGPISRFNGDQFIPIDGAGNRISVDHDGYPIISNTHGDIYWRFVNEWQQLPGSAIDVGAGGQANANFDWVLGTEPTELGGRVYRLTRPSFTPFNCHGVKIAVEPWGLPWVVDRQGNIWRMVAYSPPNFEQVFPGQANDIGIGADGSVWIIGRGENPPICRWNGRGWDPVAWTAVPGTAVSIAVGSDGLPFIVNSQGQIFRRI